MIIMTIAKIVCISGVCNFGIPEFFKHQKIKEIDKNLKYVTREDVGRYSVGLNSHGPTVCMVAAREDDLQIITNAKHDGRYIEIEVYKCTKKEKYGCRAYHRIDANLEFQCYTNQESK